jgi:hypothetical protein
MINITLRKNKVFFAPKFGFAPFYFYTFIVKGAGWGEAGWCKGVCRLLMFSARGETAYNNCFSQGGRLLPSFFYILSQPFFAITISQLLSSILKLAVRLCCFYYPFGQVFGHGGRLMRITL